jgi:hypothetical protein
MNWRVPSTLSAATTDRPTAHATASNAAALSRCSAHAAYDAEDDPSSMMVSSAARQQSRTKPIEIGRCLMKVE